MSLPVRLLPLAEEELDLAGEYYDAQRRGLAADLFLEFGVALKRITDFPEAFATVSARARRCLLRRFPYGLIYQIRDDEILVIAVAHLRRKTDYWRGREV